MDKNTAGNEMEIAGVVARRSSTGAVRPGTPGRQRPQPKMAGSGQASGAPAPGSRSSTGSQRSLSYWLLLVFYPFALSLGTYPVTIGSVTVGAEFLFAILCAVVTGVETASGKLKVAPGNPYFLLGLTLWLGANAASLLVHPEREIGNLLFRMLLKAMLGYMVFWVLQANGRVGVLLKSYLAGCALCGLATIAYGVEFGTLEAIRSASYVGVEIDIFSGLAQAGSFNLLPVWICVVLYPNIGKKWQRTGLLALIVYFMAVAMLALRREVLVETVVGLGVLWFVMPLRSRPFIVLGGLLLAGVLVGTIALSESWQGRLFGETREAFETGTDPRTVMLRNTPAEFWEEPLLGHGPGSYQFRMTKYFPEDMVFPGGGIAAHNSFSRAAVESGIVGLSGFCLMVAALGWRAVRRRTEFARSGFDLRLVAVMIFLHLGDWLFFGDGFGSNTVWFFVGVLLYLDWCLLRKDSRGIPPARQMMKPRRDMTITISS